MLQVRKRVGIFLKKYIIYFGLFLLFIILVTGEANKVLHKAYQGEISTRILDKNGALLQLLPNQKGHYMTQGGGSPRVRELVVQKEDRFFYYHPGVNPLSIMRSVVHGVLYGKHQGGSTITQQLVKNLLQNENDRTLYNKIVELLYAISLDFHTPKNEILTMYLGSAYFGKQVEGIEGASQYYFGKSTADLTDGEVLRLLTLLSSPGSEPGSRANTTRSENAAKRLGVVGVGAYTELPRSIRDARKDPAMFELSHFIATSTCGHTCTLSVDRELTLRIRDIIRDGLNSRGFESATNAAVVVIKLGVAGAPNTLLALVGSPDPYGYSEGSQINMALSPRPIGSTWKPFIYGKAIEKGARPYSIIPDTEYRHEIGTGYAFYPKNYDGIYRGDVTMHYALSNSLNVPAVRALQFDGIEDFGTFMKDELDFIPRQPLDTYQLSIALGGLEMNPLLLAHYFTTFPRGGILAPLTLLGGAGVEIPMFKVASTPKRIFSATTTSLLNAMLKDRLMGVEQFGLQSNLNLPFEAYAVKTGTSYDYHDSWTVGYTSDVVVVVWVGNSNNKAMDLVTGAKGAGKIWYDVMTLLYARTDISPEPFKGAELVDVRTGEGISFGLHDYPGSPHHIITKTK